MATKTAFPPDVMAALQTQTKFAVGAKKSSSPFASFSGPVGRYFARLQRIAVTFSKKDGSAIFNCYHTCLASCPDAASDSAVPDQTHAGLAMRNSLRTSASAKSTKAEAWERAMVGLQSYGLKTRNFGVRNGQEVQDDGKTFWRDLADAVDLLNDKRPAIIIDVTESADKKYKNCNVRDLVDEETVERFAQANFEVSDEDMELPEDEVEGDIAEGGTQTAAPSLEDATAAVADYDHATLTSELAGAGVELGFPADQHTVEQLRQIAAAFISKTEIPVFTDPLKTQLGGGVGGQTMSNRRIVSQDGKDPVTLSDDEEEDDEEDDGEDKTVKLQMAISVLSRDALKQAIRNAGGLRPDDKFKKSDTDEDLRQRLFDLKTGKVAPVSVVVPDELSF